MTSPHHQHKSTIKEWETSELFAADERRKIEAMLPNFEYGEMMSISHLCAKELSQSHYAAHFSDCCDAQAANCLLPSTAKMSQELRHNNCSQGCCLMAQERKLFTGIVFKCQRSASILWREARLEGAHPPTHLHQTIDPLRPVHCLFTQADVVFLSSWAKVFHITAHLRTFS